MVAASLDVPNHHAILCSQSIPFRRLLPRSWGWPKTNCRSGQVLPASVAGMWSIGW